MRVSPRMAKAHLGRGTARFYLGRYLLQRGEDPTPQFSAALEEDLAAAVEANPSFPESYRVRANVQGWWGVNLKNRGLDPEPRLTRCFEDFATAIRLNPHSAPAYAQRGEIRLRIGEAADSLRDFQAAVRISAALEANLTPLIEEARRAVASASDY